MFFSYVVRNLIARRGSTLSTVLVIASTVAVVTGLLGVLEGLSDMVKLGGNPLNATVVSKGAHGDVESMIDWPLVATVQADPAVDQSGGAQVSPEFITLILFRGERAEDSRSIKVRGVDPIAYRLHGVQPVTGAAPSTGSEGLLLGTKLLGRYPSLHEGGTVRIGRTQWPIVGTFSAPNTPYESEIWCDRTAMLNAFHRQQLSILSVRLTSAEQEPGFQSRISRVTDGKDLVHSEPEERREQLKTVSSFVDAIVVVVLLLSLGAIITCLGALYTAFLGRLRELATLYVVGFRRRQLARLIVQEGVVLTLFGGGLGLLLSLLVNGRPIPVDEYDSVLYATVHISPRVFACGLALSIVVGALGSVVAIVHAMYTSMIDALHH
jgi:ABC-type lipoprotein release transport system permease subunit